MLSNTGESVVQVRNLREFFRDSVSTAISNQHLTVSDHTSHYVVNLLTLFARSEELYRDTSSSRSIDPLALMLSRAMESESEEKRNVALQRLGDIALFVAGFFSRRFDDCAVDKGYYVDMGGNAYGCLATHVRGTTRGKAIGPVFRELANKFVDMVDVLNEISEHTAAVTATDVVGLYREWRKTGSKRAANRLKQFGVELFPVAVKH